MFSLTQAKRRAEALSSLHNESWLVFNESGFPPGTIQIAGTSPYQAPALLAVPKLLIEINLGFYC
jgi:hypothetical protein